MRALRYLSPLLVAISAIALGRSTGPQRSGVAPASPQGILAQLAPDDAPPAALHMKPADWIALVVVGILLASWFRRVERAPL
jgi:hypothetical protein